MTHRISSTPNLTPAGLASTEKPAEPAKSVQFAGYHKYLSEKQILATLAAKFENICQAVLKAFTGISGKKSAVNDGLANDILGRLNSQSVPRPDGTAQGLGDVVRDKFEQANHPLTYGRSFIAYVNETCLPAAAEPLKTKFYKDHEKEFLTFIGNKGPRIDPDNEKHGVMRAFVQFCVFAAAEDETYKIDDVLDGAARVLKQLDDAVNDKVTGGITEGLRDGALALIMTNRPRDILDLMSHDDGNRFVAQTAIKDIVKQENYIYPSQLGYVAHPAWEKS